MASLSSNQLEKRKKINKVLLLTFLAIIIIIGLLYNSTPDNSPPSSKDAFSIAKEYVRKDLIDPPSAEFVKGTEVITSIDAYTYVVRGTVKATNRMGLKAPKEYTIRITNIGNKDDVKGWNVEFLDFK